ncbi:hypothetical protein O4443_04545 [Xylella fastidiosa subsp. pauca]|nr:hypothetical protein [Xylella fastidiosa]MDG5822867.1 hypothetical protein [Xylella fastidiosa subsp. pauca]WGZ31182.1 hypothetical protein O4444_06500 [Xylella fastidiosa subsp. pauca]WGZ37431.1 hypothetical protein O4443_04545 [Xylella fastidiosa subsp. pauca]
MTRRRGQVVVFSKAINGHGVTMPASRFGCGGVGMISVCCYSNVMHMKPCGLHTDVVGMLAVCIGGESV